jgi:hypothetical protein
MIFARFPINTFAFVCTRLDSVCQSLEKSDSKHGKRLFAFQCFRFAFLPKSCSTVLIFTLPVWLRSCTLLTFRSFASPITSGRSSLFVSYCTSASPSLSRSPSKDNFHLFASRRLRLMPHVSSVPFSLSSLFCFFRPLARTRQ